MIIEIDDLKTIADIQEKFNTFFPFLKIEFYKEPHHWYEGSADLAILPNNKKIADIRKQHPHAELEIHSWHRTGDVEQTFRKTFHLFVQVFRREADKWVQTISSDKLTLGEQNELGQSISESKSTG